MGPIRPIVPASDVRETSPLMSLRVGFLQPLEKPAIAPYRSFLDILFNRPL